MANLRYAGQPKDNRSLDLAQSVIPLKLQNWKMLQRDFKKKILRNSLRSLSLSFCLCPFIRRGLWSCPPPARGWAAAWGRGRCRRRSRPLRWRCTSNGPDSTSSSKIVFYAERLCQVLWLDVISHVIIIMKPLLIVLSNKNHFLILSQQWLCQ